MMSLVAIRRTKKGNVDMSQLGLPAKTIETIRVEFTSEDAETNVHSQVHSLLYAVTRQVFVAMLEGKGKTFYKNFYRLFALVTRTRQSCCHAKLVPDSSLESAREAQRVLDSLDQSDVMDEEEGQKLLDRLFEIFSSDSDDQLATECQICYEDYDENTAMVLRDCYHVFCLQCSDKIQESSFGGSGQCPFCRVPFRKADCIKKGDAESAIKASKKKKSKPAAQLTKGDEMVHSPKIVSLLAKIEDMDPDEKAVIFCQWTSHLDLIQQAMLEAGHVVTRIDGSMPAAARLEAMRDLESDEEGKPRFMLASLLAVGVGVTLTRANVVFMMSNWW
mmetsp:Transcript_16537/g.26860  ORF Transcript_16537/g.26860 Transcript_16537/m.26860 type:complete len:332 (-) Transcript_16537:68-1063(-)